MSNGKVMGKINLIIDRKIWYAYDLRNNCAKNQPEKGRHVLLLNFNLSKEQS